MQTLPEFFGTMNGSSMVRQLLKISEIILRPVKVVKDPFRKDVKYATDGFSGIM